MEHDKPIPVAPAHARACNDALSRKLPTQPVCAIGSHLTGRSSIRKLAFHHSSNRALSLKCSKWASRRHWKYIGRSPHPPQTPAAQFKRLYRNCPGWDNRAQSCLVCRDSPDRDL